MNSHPRPEVNKILFDQDHFVSSFIGLPYFPERYGEQWNTQAWSLLLLLL